MIDDCLLSLIYAAWLAASTTPLGLMLGASCSPCCGCGVADGKPRTDPKDEGTWVPSGTWRGAGGVTWSFTANPGDESGETWFFYGSQSTSRAGGGASVEEQQDWGNICNWYSSKTTSPSTISGLPGAFNKRATRLPPSTGIVHVYTSVSTVNAGPQTIKNIFFWGVESGALVLGSTVIAGSEITSTSSAHDSAGGAVFNISSIGTANTNNAGTIHGGATFNGSSLNKGIVNGGATFNGLCQNTDSTATVNGGATFNDQSINAGGGIVNGGATFNDSSSNGTAINATVNGGATFNGFSQQNGTVNGGATFNDFNVNTGTVNDGATFNVTSFNTGTVNGGATFNGSSFNGVTGTVNGGATFNDAACSRRTVGAFFPAPCTRKFVAHPTELPVCNGTARNGCFTPLVTCGCG